MHGYNHFPSPDTSGEASQFKKPMFCPYYAALNLLSGAVHSKAKAELWIATQQQRVQVKKSVSDVVKK